MHELDIDSSHLDRLVDVPVEQLLCAEGTLLARRGSGTMGGTDFQAFSPAPDGTSLFEVPTEAIAAGAAAEIPVIIGTNRDEIKLFAVWDQALHALDRDGAIARLQRTLGEDTTRIFDAYTASRPGAPPSEIAMAIASDEGFRMPAIETAEIQHTQGAPTYMYLFAWESPALGGVLGASHAVEIPFVFDNVHQPGVAILTGDGDDRGPLASAMNAAWTSFARDGVPEAAAFPSGRSTRRPRGRRWSSIGAAGWSRTRSAPIAGRGGIGPRRAERTPGHHRCRNGHPDLRSTSPRLAPK